MAMFRKTILTGSVHLTAAMLLVAGLPHFECRCPNGHRRLFCLSLFSSSLGRCMEPCCTAPPTQPEKSIGSATTSGLTQTGSCCCAIARLVSAEASKLRSGQPGFRGPNPGRTPVAKPMPCRRGVAPAKTWNTSSHQSQFVDESRAQTPLLVNSCLSIRSPWTGCERGHRYRHWHAPPDELTTLFQRLLI
jgi:hypothetical protein